ncbi:GTPase HflX [Arenicella sp. 4NH20-0111]|uniref:ribosome rescue GTPase HflX n=1 Tax=Arenicella sp. 4NH20-0111 TaxID=3127648 RepID=UPI00310C5EC1
MFEISKSKAEPNALIIYQRDTSHEDTEILEEIQLLAQSAGAVVVTTLTAFRRRPDPATFVGKGKVDEIRSQIESDDIDLVILNHSVSPIQERNLERALKVRVLDRTGLILDIFAQRATSHEGKLQVELAQLQHIATRLVRGWTHLERQKGGIGLRGPGETQLETDRRLIGHRIKSLNKRLDTVSSQRQLRRKSRAKVPVPTVSLVGYTNAGKSSLFNRITDAKVYAEDQLFATLDTTMRRVELENFGASILSDTVGFIRDLPHSLVQAFHSTLEEVANAHLLLHTVDVSSSYREECISEVDKVLKEIEASDIPSIMVYNKIDITGSPPKVVRNSDGEIERVWCSAKTGEGVDLLLGAIAEHLGKLHIRCEIVLPANNGKLRAVLYQKNVVKTESVDDMGGFHLECDLSPADMGWLKKQPNINDIKRL